MLTGDVGRLADARPRRPPRRRRRSRSSTRSSSCSPRRPRTPPRSSAGSGPRSGSRTSTTASAPSSTSAGATSGSTPATSTTSAASSRRSSTAARDLPLGRDPRRRAPRLARRRRPAVHRAPGAARAQVAVGRRSGREVPVIYVAFDAARRSAPGGGRRRSSRCSREPLRRAPRAGSRPSTCRSPTTAAGSPARTSAAVDSVDGLEAAFADGPRPAQRGADGQGPDERLLAGPARPRLAEDEEGARDDRLRRRRRRGRPRQAPRRPVSDYTFAVRDDRDRTGSSRSARPTAA